MDRWAFRQDMDQDGLISGTDFLLWGEWLFYLPGDSLLLATMRWLPDVAAMFALSEASFGQTLSKLLSIAGWVLGLWGIGHLVADLDEEVAWFRERHKTRFDIRGAGLGLVLASVFGLGLGLTLGLDWLVVISPPAGLVAGGLVGRSYHRRRLGPP